MCCFDKGPLLLKQLVRLWRPFVGKHRVEFSLMGWNNLPPPSHPPVPWRSIVGRSHDPAGLLVIAPFGEQIRVLQNSSPLPPPHSSPPQPPPPSHPSPLTADLPLHLPLPHVKDLCLPHSGQLMRASENTEVGLNEGETWSGRGGWRWEGQKNHGPAAAASFFSQVSLPHEWAAISSLNERSN